MLKCSFGSEVNAKIKENEQKWGTRINLQKNEIKQMACHDVIIRGSCRIRLDIVNEKKKKFKAIPIFCWTVKANEKRKIAENCTQKKIK